MAQVLESQRGPVTGTAVGKKKRRPFLLDLYSTAVGKKYVMAITGIGLIGFVVFHMIGNLKMYFGQSDLDHYAEFLKELLYPIAPKGVVLWLLRGGLLTMVVLHIHAAYSLTQLNHKARPVKYQSERDYQVASFASRSMRYTGVTDSISPLVSSIPSEPTENLFEPMSTTMWCAVLSVGQLRCFIFWPTSCWVSTSSTACGAFFNRWAGTAHASMNGDVPLQQELQRSLL